MAELKLVGNGGFILAESADEANEIIENKCPGCRFGGISEKPCGRMNPINYTATVYAYPESVIDEMKEKSPCLV